MLLQGFKQNTLFVLFVSFGEKYVLGVKKRFCHTAVFFIHLYKSINQRENGTGQIHQA